MWTERFAEQLGKLSREEGLGRVDESGGLKPQHGFVDLALVQIVDLSARDGFRP